MEKQNDRLITLSSIFLLLQFLFDFIGTRGGIVQEATIFLTIIKGIKSLFLLLMVLILVQRKIWQPIYGLLGLGLLVLLGQFNLYQTWREIPWTAILREWLLYGGGFVMAFFFNSLYSGVSAPKFRLVLHFTIGFILIVCLSVLISFIFDIQLLRTYQDGLRFGYAGILHKSITATYFFIGSICLVYYYTYRQQKISPWIFYIVISCSFLVGTKGIYLFNGIFLAYSFIVHQWYKKAIFYRLFLLVCLGIVLFYKRILMELNPTITLFSSIYKEHGLLTSLMSFRNEILLQKASIYIDTWGILNYFVGGKLPELGLFEMSVVDMYAFCGWIGLIYVVVLYYKGVCTYTKEKESKQYLRFCYLSILIISIFAGQLFVNFSSIFFILWVLFLINNGEIVKKID